MRATTGTAGLYGLVLIAAAVPFISWAFVIEPASLRIVEYRIDVPDWPDSFPDIKVAVIADLHVGSPFIDIDQVVEIVKLTNAQSPDLIVLPGDFVVQDVPGGTAVDPTTIAKTLSGLNATLGVWGVLGNHDRWHGATVVRNSFEASGIPMLENRSVPLTHRGIKLWLVGISDYSEKKHDFDRAFSEVPKAAPFLAMTHSPDVFPLYPYRSGLLIASHTHGGQVNLPFLGRLVVPSRYKDRYAAGIIQEDRKRMFVSSGIGTSILPVRFRVPPEISILNLRPLPHDSDESDPG